MKAVWVFGLAVLSVGLSLGGWLVTLWMLEQHGNLDTEAALSAAQVFTGVAGFGAGAIALFAVYQELKPKQPHLTLFVYQDEGHLWRAYVSNDGSAPALGCRVQISGHTVAQAERLELVIEQRDFWAPTEVAEPFNQGGDPGNWNHIMELVFAREIEPGVAKLRIAEVRWPGDHVNFWLRGENVRADGLRWNSQSDKSGVQIT